MKHLACLEQLASALILLASFAGAALPQHSGTQCAVRACGGLLCEAMLLF